jgi:hypothetical protein
LARARFIKRALNQIFQRLRTPPRRQANPDTITVLLVGLDPTGCVPPLPSLAKASAAGTEHIQ